MKTADKMKYESRVETDKQSEYFISSTFADSHKKSYNSLCRPNIDEEQSPFSAIDGTYLQLEQKARLTSSLESFKILVDNASVGICIVREDMRHAYANRKYCEITGYSVSELKKVEIARLVSANKREAFKNANQLFLSNEANTEKTFIATAIRKNGEKCSIECSKVITIWKGKPAVHLIVRDITESLDRENKIKATSKLLSDKIENITEKLISSSERLKQKQRELVFHKLELEKVSQELLQTNRAMSILARNIDKKKNEVEQKTAHTVLTKIIPIINDLKKEKGIQKYLAEIEVLNAYIKGLAPESDLHNKIVINLSASEMRIAALIKNGMSSKAIADMQNISLETVKTHRKKIRRKLDIRNSKTNLTSYLRSVMVEP